MPSSLIIRQLEPQDSACFEAAFAAIGWTKPAATFDRYLKEQREGRRVGLVAEVDSKPVAYVTLCWPGHDDNALPDVPEIVDLNVLPEFRSQGIGSALMDRAEELAATRSNVVTLGVGLHGGYGAAQRLYVRRGYVPDGQGAVIDGCPVPEGATVELGDSLSIRMTKRLR